MRIFPFLIFENRIDFILWFHPLCVFTFTFAREIKLENRDLPLIYQI